MALAVLIGLQAGCQPRPPVQEAGPLIRPGEGGSSAPSCDLGSVEEPPVLRDVASGTLPGPRIAAVVLDGRVSDRPALDQLLAGAARAAQAAGR